MTLLNGRVHILCVQRWITFWYLQVMYKFEEKNLEEEEGKEC